MINVFDAFIPQKSWISGEMRLSGEIQGPVDAINGHLVFNAKDGEIKKSYVLADIFSILNFYKLIKSGQFELGQDNFPYNKVSSTFEINKGLVSFNDFYLDSNSLQLSAVGTFSLYSRQIDATIGLQPLETFDMAIGAIPVFGWVITGDQGRFIVVNMTVKGSADNPEIKVAPVDSISQPIIDIFKRVFKLPVKIIQEPVDLIRRKPKRPTPRPSGQE